MRYLLLLWDDSEAVGVLAPEERRAIVEEHMAFSKRLREADVMVLGEPLGPPVGVLRDGVVTDGPFVETKEQIGGFYVLECGSREEALEWAKQVPRSPGLVVEVSEIAQV
jgi:hypothetical protein